MDPCLLARSMDFEFSHSLRIFLALGVAVEFWHLLCALYILHCTVSYGYIHDASHRHWTFYLDSLSLFLWLMVVAWTHCSAMNPCVIAIHIDRDVLVFHGFLDWWQTTYLCTDMGFSSARVPCCLFVCIKSSQGSCVQAGWCCDR